MSLDKIEKLLRLATKNPNKNEAMVAARKFVEAVERENINVYLSKEQKPATQIEIKQAIDNAYRKGIADVKNHFQQELDRNLNAKYNEGFLDGKREGYTYQDLQESYKKGYKEGKKSNSIEKAQPSKITKKETHNSIFIAGNSTAIGTTGHVSFNNSTTTIRVGT